MAAPAVQGSSAIQYVSEDLVRAPSSRFLALRDARRRAMQPSRHSERALPSCSSHIPPGGKMQPVSPNACTMQAALHTGGPITQLAFVDVPHQRTPAVPPATRPPVLASGGQRQWAHHCGDHEQLLRLLGMHGGLRVP